MPVAQVGIQIGEFTDVSACRHTVRGFPKKRLAGKGNAYFLAFARETCRAEATHWVIMLFAPLFFLWNPVGVGFFMILYALAENIPLIMAQRYNRYRLRRVVKEGQTEQVRAVNG